MKPKWLLKITLQITFIKVHSYKIACIFLQQWILFKTKRTCQIQLALKCFRRISFYFWVITDFIPKFSFYSDSWKVRGKTNFLEFSLNFFFVSPKEYPRHRQHRQHRYVLLGVRSVLLIKGETVIWKVPDHSQDKLYITTEW
jgi:hypothetical protein